MIRFVKRSGLLVALLLVTTQVGLAQDLNLVAPESVGLSSERLGHLDRLVDRQIEEDLLAGAVVLLAREGKVAYLRAAGMQDRAAGEPMQEETIFRIASMSKPITSVAVMMLYEAGHFRLSDPVSDYIPAFEDMRVLADSADSSKPLAERATVDAERPVTIRHLLTHTSGLAYQWNPQLGEAYEEAGGLRQLGHEIVEGSGTIYSAPYPTSDTHRYFSGGGGLTSTVPDYFRFAQMLLNGGELDGVRILSPKTVELMRTDHVGPLMESNGFGLGLRHHSQPRREGGARVARHLLLGQLLVRDVLHRSRRGDDRDQRGERASRRRGHAEREVRDSRPPGDRGGVLPLKKT